jgi:hypothetical protein
VTGSTFDHNIAFDFGGGIANVGTLTLTNSTLSGNTALSQVNALGGGIANFGALQVANCTLSGNSALSGGGIETDSGTLTLTNSTLSGNTANAGITAGGIGSVGGTSGASTTLVNCTVAGNTNLDAAGPGGLFAARTDSGQASFTLQNTIVADNSGTQFGTAVETNFGGFNLQGYPGAFVSQGYNLSSDASGNLSQPGDQQNTEPLLGPLQDNGGPLAGAPGSQQVVPTRALLPGSPAIDAGNNALAVNPATGLPLSTDERGFDRVANGTVDIGAFEVQLYQVYSTADGGPGSLRTALTNADQAGGSVIAFTTGGTINLASPLPDITRSVQILGPGANNLTVQRSTAPGTPAFRIFTVDQPGSGVQDVNVTLSGLTIANGQTSLIDGGGIDNSATLKVINCTLTGNSATYNGGAIANERGGALTVTNSTLANNSAGYGGGIDNFGTLTVRTSTLSGNSAYGGGGIFNGGSLVVTDSTIAANSAAIGGGIALGPLTLANTILAGNTAPTGPDVFATLTSLGYNLIGDPSDSSGFVATDLLGYNPLLAPLGNYGGPTQTMALLPGSPAIDAGSNNLLPADLSTDQRGFARIVNGTVDIGAFESRGFVLSVAGGNNQQAFLNTPFASPLSVTVTSPFGEPVQGGVVIFAVPPSGASATFPGPDTATIDASGQAAVSVIANAVPGSYLVTAAANGAAGSASLTLTNLPSIALNPASLPDATAGVAYSQALTATGGAGGPYTFAVTAGALPAGFSLSSSGILSGSTTLAGTSSFTVTATDSSGFTGSQAYTLTIDPAAAASFAVGGFPSPTTAGVAGTFSVTAHDAYGNVATGYSGTIHFTSSDPQAVLPANATLGGGTGTFSATLKTAGSQSLTATDTTNAAVTGSESGITVNPAATSQFVVVGFPSPVTAGVAGTFTVTAEDVYGNVTPSYSGTVRFSSSDPQAVLPANATLTNGVGHFSVTLKTAGTQSLTATDTANAAITGSETGIQVNPGVATHFRIAGPSSVPRGTAFNLTVTALDAYGNVATGYSGTVKLDSSENSAKLPDKYTYTASDQGVHQFTGLVLKKKGWQTITVFDTSNNTILGTISIDVL